LFALRGHDVGLDRGPRGFGLELFARSVEPSAVYVSAITPGGPASLCELDVGDIVLAINGKSLASATLRTSPLAVSCV
jgi:S1-C subfamily serine protease